MENSISGRPRLTRSGTWSSCLPVSRSTFRARGGTGQRLDEALRDAAFATPESLPLLEYVLSLLYDKQEARGDGLLRWSDYREVGELKGALAKHAEEVFGILRPQEQRAFPLVTRYLVTLGQGEEEVPNRRTAPYRDLPPRRRATMIRKPARKALLICLSKSGCSSRTPIPTER